jgi:hypothetical protein
VQQWISTWPPSPRGAIAVFVLQAHAIAIMEFAGNLLGIPFLNRHVLDEHRLENEHAGHREQRG